MKRVEESASADHVAGVLSIRLFQENGGAKGLNTYHINSLTWMRQA
jgi:hypothetical protein